MKLGNWDVTLGDSSVEGYPATFDISYDCTGITDNYDYAGIVVLPGVLGTGKEMLPIDLRHSNDSLHNVLFPDQPYPNGLATFGNFIDYIDLKKYLPDGTDYRHFCCPLYPFNAMRRLPENKRGDINTYLDTSLESGHIKAKNSSVTTTRAKGEVNLYRGLYPFASMAQLAESGAGVIVLTDVPMDNPIDKIIDYMQSDQFEADTGYVFDYDELDFIEYASAYTFINMRNAENDCRVIAIIYRGPGKFELRLINSGAVRELRQMSMNKFISFNYGENRRRTPKKQLGIENTEYYFETENGLVPPRFYVYYKALLITVRMDTMKDHFTCVSGIRFAQQHTVNYFDFLLDTVNCNLGAAQGQFLQMIPNNQLHGLKKTVRYFSNNIETYYLK